MKNQNLACQLGPNLPGRRAAVCAIGAAGYGLAAACLPVGRTLKVPPKRTLI